MPLPAVLGAIGPSVAAGAASLIGQERANRINIRLAREQMRFQERMSGTAWQRAVKDMKLAGINPMLAYQQGGATSPSGQTARVEDVIGPAVSSAMHLMRMRQELRVMRAQEQKAIAEGREANARARIDEYGTLTVGPDGYSSHIPYGGLMRRAQWISEKARPELIKGQARALKFGSLPARLVGTDLMKGIRDAIFGRQESGRIRYQRRPSFFDEYLKKRSR